MAELYSVGKQANKETADEIIAGLESMGTFIPTTETVRREYRHVLLKEYQEFVEVHERERGDKKLSPDAPEGGTGQ
jgi:hypothetical protein